MSDIVLELEVDYEVTDEDVAYHDSLIRGGMQSRAAWIWLMHEKLGAQYNVQNAEAVLY